MVLNWFVGSSKNVRSRSFTRGCHGRKRRSPEEISDQIQLRQRERRRNTLIHYYSCTSLLFIWIFIKSQYTVFAHFICCALFILLHILLFISLFLYLCSCYFYKIFIFILLHCPLSGPDLIYISLLIIPCIIYYVTNKETLNLEPTQNHDLIFRKIRVYIKRDPLIHSSVCVYKRLRSVWLYLKEVHQSCI